MKDHYLRALSVSGGIRILVCTISELAGEICSLQNCSFTVSVALGRGLAGGALMGGLLKDGQRVALKFEGNGPMAKMIIEAESDGAVRGTVGNPAAEAEPIAGRWNVPGVLGLAGFLTVTMDLGMGGDLYRGMVQLQSSEIGDDIALYLTDSEQVPSAVGLGVFLGENGHIKTCGGFLLQALPGADGSEIDEIMGRLAQLPPLAEILASGGTAGLLASVMGSIPYTILEEKRLFFKCGCSREKVEQALHSLGGDELKDIRVSAGYGEVTCEFCRTSYRFESAELERMESLCRGSIAH